MLTLQIPFGVEFHRGGNGLHTQLGEGGSPAYDQENSSSRTCTLGLLSLGRRERNIRDGPPAVSHRQDNSSCSVALGAVSLGHTGIRGHAAIHACYLEEAQSITPLADGVSPAGGIPLIQDARPTVNLSNSMPTSSSTYQIIRGPFTGCFQGCTWNCRSMWSKRQSSTFSFALTLADAHDFCIYTETRETKTRRLMTLDAMPENLEFFSSGIGARKGGIGIMIKKAFLNQLTAHKWSVASCGRVASLTLDGPCGTLNIIVTYFDPASVEGQLSGINCVQTLLITEAHDVIAGDWNLLRTD